MRQLTCENRGYLDAGLVSFDVLNLSRVIHVLFLSLLFGGGQLGAQPDEPVPEGGWQLVIGAPEVFIYGIQDQSGGGYWFLRMLSDAEYGLSGEQGGVVAVLSHEFPDCASRRSAADLLAYYEDGALYPSENNAHSDGVMRPFSEGSIAEVRYEYMCGRREPLFDIEFTLQNATEVFRTHLNKEARANNWFLLTRSSGGYYFIRPGAEIGAGDWVSWVGRSNPIDQALFGADFIMYRAHVVIDCDLMSVSFDPAVAHSFPNLTFIPPPPNSEELFTYQEQVSRRALGLICFDEGRGEIGLDYEDIRALLDNLALSD